MFVIGPSIHTVGILYCAPNFGCWHFGNVQLFYSNGKNQFDMAWIVINNNSHAWHN